MTSQANHGVRLRVLHLIGGLDVGGAEHMLARLVSPSNAVRTEPVVVTLRDGGTLTSQIADAGIPLLSLGARRGLSQLLVFYRFVKLLRRISPDVVQTWMYHADLVGLVASPFAGGVPLLWNIRRARRDPDDLTWRFRALRKALAAASRRPAVVISNSVAGRRAHEAMGYKPVRWEIIPNGFDTDVFQPCRQARDAVRHELALPGGTTLVGIMARVHPVKDHETFLRAAALVAAVRDDVHFVLIGRDTNRSESLAALTGDLGIGSRVHLLGERSDGPRLLAALDVLVSSSHSEAFSNVIAEAMACGVPCVVTDVGDSAAIVANTGTVVPPRDPAALAAGVLELLAIGSEGLRARGMAARARIIAEYSLASVVRRYETLYADVGRHARASRKRTKTVCAE